MKRFGDFGIEVNDKKIFDIPQISIEDVINQEIEVLDYQAGVTTSHGDDRYVLKIRHEDKEVKFFTSAAPIKKALDLIPPEDYPFLTTIKQRRFGKGSKKTFEFT